MQTATEWMNRMTKKAVKPVYKEAKQKFKESDQTGYDYASYVGSLEACVEALLED